MFITENFTSRKIPVPKGPNQTATTARASMGRGKPFVKMLGGECVCCCDKPETCRVSSSLAEAAKKAGRHRTLRKLRRRRRKLRRRRRRSCIPESERLILTHTNSDDADPDALLLAAKTAQIVNVYLSIPLVHEAEKMVGVSAAVGIIVIL